jgi:hypothetical protein
VVSFVFSSGALRSPSSTIFVVYQDDRFAKFGGFSPKTYQRYINHWVSTPTGQARVVFAHENRCSESCWYCHPLPNLCSPCYDGADLENKDLAAPPILLSRCGESSNTSIADQDECVEPLPLPKTPLELPKLCVKHLVQFF